MSKEETIDAVPGATTTIDAPAQIMGVLPRLAIVPSKTNPRTHFDAAYIQELAASIRAHKLLQPLLVRPLPAARLQDTFEDTAPGQPRPTHEIVCGECRWRACGLAEEDNIPVLIRHLSDVQVLQVQLVENLKRKDLHPLEEAEGFERLMKDHGMAAEEIAAKVDKSVSQIYKTLKLLELTPECREQLYAGKLTRSTALLVACSPGYLQAQIAKDIMTPDWQGETMSYRKARSHIQQNYMLQLSAAVFDIKDAALLPKAGDCASCAKRTGAHTDLFEDIKGPDCCTDPKCFDAKKVAHHARVAEAAKAKGQTVIQGKEAKELMPHEHSTPKGFTLLDEKQYINGRTQSVRSAIGKANVPTPIVIINPHTKEAQEALPVDVANKLLKKAQSQQKAGDKDKPPSEQELKRQYNDAWKTKAVRQIFAAITAGQGQAFGIDVARQLALYLAHDVYNEDAELVAELLGIDGKVGRGDAIQTYIKECPAEQVAPALLLCSMIGDLDQWSDETPFIGVLARDTGIDLQALQREAKAEMKAAAAARKLEADARAGALKHPANKPAGKKKKASAEEAKTGIAQALQEETASVNDFKVGQRVRFKMDLKGPTGKLRKVCGREGTIECKNGHRGWMVRHGEKSYEIAGADYTELEHVDGELPPFFAEGKVIARSAPVYGPDGAPPKIGDRVRIKDSAKNAKLRGREATLVSYMGTKWFMRFALAGAKVEGKNSTTLDRADFVVLEEDAAGAVAPPPSAATTWPFPTSTGHPA